MATQVLIFDIGGTVFDWNTALLEALKFAFPTRTPLISTAARSRWPAVLDFWM